LYDLRYESEVAIYNDYEEKKILAIPKECCLGLFEAANPPSLKDESEYLKSLLFPVSGLPLSEISKKKKAKNAAIIISDVTREVPTKKVAKHLVDQLMAGGIEKEKITFFVALGVHRPATEEEIKSFVGDELYGSVAIENHDAYNPEKLVDLGRTSFNTPVKVNKKAYFSDVKVIVGKVELHEMAGFSGGRKSILPGVASEETILINHRPEMIFNKGTGAGNLDGNPIHEDMLETAKMFGVDFGVNFVVDNSGQPSAVFAGGLEESHLAAVDYLRQFCKVTIPQKADIFVITPGNPLNCDFYQGVKSLFAIQHILTPDSVVLLYGAFPEGINSSDYVAPFHKFPDNLEKARSYTCDNYKIQMDHTLPTIDILMQGTKIIICAKTLPPEEIKTLGMIPCSELKDAFTTAVTLSFKQKPLVAFCPHPQRAVIRYKFDISRKNELR
jgi:nickel-dependent lactate racemase